MHGFDQEKIGPLGRLGQIVRFHKVERREKLRSKGLKDVVPEEEEVPKPEIPEEEAKGKVREIYDKQLKEKGFVNDITKVFSMRPEFMEAWQTLNDALKANMEERIYELATISATSGIRCTA